MSDQKQQSGQPHKRRPHYSGKYPRRYEEKYKELNPEKYKAEAEHVIEKGNTPAGTHIPIMVNEILDFLKIRPGQQGLDCTLGYGGHTSKMLEMLDGHGHLYSLDYDPIEIIRTTERLRGEGYSETIWTPVNTNFVHIDQIAEKYGKFDFLLADLGVSSMQIDNPARGFTWKADGPLDLRFNPQKGQPASERLRAITEEEFEGMMAENSDEPYADRIAAEVFRQMKRGEKFETTFALRRAIEQAVASAPDFRGASKYEIQEAQKKSCARVFQALRIDVNSEFEVLYEFLEKLPDVLKEGGRAAILTFHSGEDRLVKKAFKAGMREGLYSEIAKDAIRPTSEECYRNPRAHSTKFRWAVKR
ncbi:MAG: 16S rRNA (cytosine(1402)-N(4))-methyltransferase RsmH [Lachnospiraceae bacterium]|nr:16S rRNA (cytosine(1402)-N(4))-methyltransferase RsmH [Lachnospiraceae bacterium]